MAGATATGHKAKRKQALRGEGIVEAFASTIVSFQLSEPADLNSRLLEVISAWRREDEGITTSNVMGWHSPRTLFTRKDPAVLEFAQHVRTALVAYVRRYIPDFDPAKRASFTEGWVNINGPGGFNTPHTHDEFQVSGCYYVSVPESASPLSGAIEFLNPASAVPPLLELGRKMAPAKFRVSPKSGQMLIFPANVSHWVLPNQEQEDRVSIAFNLRVMD